MQSEERRKSERIPVRVKFTLHMGSSEQIELWSKDISTSGVALECPSVVAQAIRLGEKVMLTVHYSPEEFDTVAAEAVRVAPGNHAMRGSVGFRFDREAGLQFAA
ncbi:MAG: PilZ domain-containing protein [Gammaproteobacteria bacterium]|nr:PilZ domain-containing protein [Gammaproteobacteria bacterium]